MKTKKRIQTDDQKFMKVSEKELLYGMIWRSTLTKNDTSLFCKKVKKVLKKAKTFGTRHQNSIQKLWKARNWWCKPASSYWAITSSKTKLLRQLYIGFVQHEWKNHESPIRSSIDEVLIWKTKILRHFENHYFLSWQEFRANLDDYLDTNQPYLAATLSHLD